MIFILPMIFLSWQVCRYLLVEHFFFSHKQNDSRVRKSVSILQPILSGDSTLWSCLARNLNAQTFQNIEWIWLVDKNDTEAIQGCRKLKRTFASKDIHIIICPLAPPTVNPKTFKLIIGTQQAQGEVISVLDDDTILPNFGIDEAISYLDDEKAGLVFGLPYYENHSTIWSFLVSSLVNSHNLLTYIPYTYFAPPLTINGMFYVIEKKKFQKMKGFEGLETQLCDDYAVAQRVIEHNFTLIQSPVRHSISTQINSFTHFHRLLLRWFTFPQVSIFPTLRFREILIFFLSIGAPLFFTSILTILSVIFPIFIIPTLIYIGGYSVLLSLLNIRYLQGTGYLGGMLLMQLITPVYAVGSLFSKRVIFWRGKLIKTSLKNDIQILEV